MLLKVLSVIVKVKDIQGCCRSRPPSGSKSCPQNRLAQNSDLSSRIPGATSIKYRETRTSVIPSSPAVGSLSHLSTMDRLSRLVTCLLIAILPLVAALKFDLHAVSSHDASKYERCVRNFVAKDQLVVVTAILDGYRGDGQKVDMHVCCIHN